MRHEQKILQKHVRHWRERGLVGEEQASKLLAASDELIGGGASLLVRGALAVLGGGLVLAGLLLVIAENWEAIDRFTKLGAWALLQLLFLGLAYELGRRFPDRPALAEAAALVAGGFALGGIALVSQIYQLDARPPNGAWLWLALVLPMAFVLPRRAPAAVVVTALLAVLVLETQQPGSLVEADHAEGPWLWLGLPLLAFGAVSLLPRPLDGLRGIAGAWTFAVSQFFLLVFGASHHLDHSDLGRAFAVALPGVLWGLTRPASALPGGLSANEWRALLAASLAPWVLMGARYEPDSLPDLAAVGLAWIVQMALAILVVRAGARAQAPGWINAGYVAIATGILVRYFDFFGDYLEGGLALTTTGLLILFVLYTLERSRRRALGQATAVEGRR